MTFCRFASAALPPRAVTDAARLWTRRRAEGARVFPTRITQNGLRRLQEAGRPATSQAIGAHDARGAGSGAGEPRVSPASATPRGDLLINLYHSFYLYHS